MTDQKMDDRLRAAGARWREENVPAVADDSPDDEILVHLPAPRRSRTRWLTAASAAVVAAALVIGGVYVVRHNDSKGDQDVASPAAALIGPTWTMPGTGVELTFTPSQVNTRYLCSKYDYALDINADQLTVGGTVGTPEDCSYPAPQPSVYAELERYSKVLSGRVQWSIERNTLTLTKAGVGSIQLTRPVQLADVEGVNWGVTGTTNSLVFGDGTVRISESCASATYRVTFTRGDVVLLRSIGTPTVCADPGTNGHHAVPSSIDAKFAAVVSGDFTVTLVGGTLTVSKNGAGSIQLTSQGAAPELQGTLWKLTEIGNENAARLDHVSNTTTLRIDGNGNLRTDDQCGNGVGGSVDLTDTTLSITHHLAQTEIGCSDRVLNDGAVIISNVFNRTVQWTIRGTTLVLTNAAGTLIYTVTAPTKPAQVTLPGTSWNLTDVQLTSNTANGSTSMTPAVVDTTLTFTDNGFTLSDGCYEVAGTVAFATGEITLSGAHEGQDPGARCDANKGRTQQEADLGKLLSDGAVTWTFSNDTLSLSAYNITAAFGRHSTTSGTSALTASNWTLTDTSTESTSGSSSTGGGSSAITQSDLVFSTDGTFTLAHKCYSMVGKYNVDGAAITVSGVHGADQLPCPSNAEPAGGQQEDDFVDAVLANGASTFSIDKGSLALTRKSHTADFASQANGAAALRASHWELGEIHRSGASLQPSTSAEFNFAQDVVSGEERSAPATITDTTIDVTGRWSGHSSKLSAAQRSFVYDKVLLGELTYTLIGDTLTITKAGVGAIVLFKK